MKSSIASKSAFIAGISFILAIVASSILMPPAVYSGQPPLSVILTAGIFIIFHLAMLPVISAVKSPDWAKSAGFIWVAVDNMLEMMSFFGVGGELVIPMRWGIHISIVVWLIGAGLVHRGFYRWLSFIVALVLLAITFSGPFLPRQMVPATLGPGGILFIVWIFTSGIRLAKNKN